MRIRFGSRQSGGFRGSGGGRLARSRFKRAIAKRSSIELIRVRDFPTEVFLDDACAGDVCGVRDAVSRAGEIFSKVKAGIVYPLFVELKHSWIPPCGQDVNASHRTSVPGRLARP